MAAIMPPEQTTLSHSGFLGYYYRTYYSSKFGCLGVKLYKYLHMSMYISSVLGMTIAS
jgi:hypothetical protein